VAGVEQPSFSIFRIMSGSADSEEARGARVASTPIERTLGVTAQHAPRLVDEVVDRAGAVLDVHSL
jgi:hypothetical protein